MRKIGMKLRIWIQKILVRLRLKDADVFYIGGSEALPAP